MEDSLQNAAELKRQADDLKHLATEMEKRVVARCEHKSLIIGASYYGGGDLVISCEECNQWAAFRLRSGSARGLSGDQKHADAETFDAAVCRRLKACELLNHTELERTSQFAELLEVRGEKAGKLGFEDGFIRGLEKARDVFRDEKTLPPETYWGTLKEEAYHEWKGAQG
jgi:hypothetical protein